MKQFSIRQLSASPSKVIAQAPCEIVNRGKVVAVIERRRAGAPPDIMARLRELRPKRWEKVDWDKAMP